MITPASVDLPDPLGPMRAWTSPWRTARSTPRRISLSSTATLRSLISRIAPFVSCDPTSFVSAIDLHLHLVAFDLHVVHGNRHGGRQAPGLAGLQVERRAVSRALDRFEVHVHLSLVEVGVGVGADVAHGPELTLPQVGHGDVPAVHVELTGLPFGDVGGSPYGDQRHDQPTPPRSSSSMAASSPVRTSAGVTRSSTSWKKPVTMRRSAWARGMPRVWR